MSQPLAIDLFCGLGGWTEGLLAEGYFVVGFDIEQHVYGEHRYPANLVIQDVLTIHGLQFKDAALIVASPPCQEYSYMAMPWSIAKAKAAAIRADKTGEKKRELTKLFDACFRIQREACEAAGRHIPMVVENVRGAERWVGRARWRYGSFCLWGDVPALMPQTVSGRKNKGGSWFNIGSPGQKVTGANPVHELSGQKLPGNNAPRLWSERRVQRLADGLRYEQDAFYCGSSGSKARKMTSAMIAKIPLPLSQHIARTFKPAATADREAA